MQFTKQTGMQGAEKETCFRKGDQEGLSEQISFKLRPTQCDGTKSKTQTVFWQK